MITPTFVLASVALLLAPGPTVVYIITQAVTHGRRAGLMCALGGVSAILIMATLVTLGLAGLLAASPVAFNMLKWAGAAYLIYVGIRALLGRTQLSFDSAAAKTSAFRLYRQGLITGVLNPKTTMFFAAFLPQFVDRSAGSAGVTLQLARLGLTFAALALFNDSIYAMLAGTMGGWLRRTPMAAIVLGKLSGLTFIGLGARLALVEQ